MAGFITMKLTQNGRNLFAKSLTGTQIEFTKMQGGSGQLAPGQDPTLLTALIDPEFDIDIVSVAISAYNIAQVKGTKNNVGFTDPVYLSELGLFADDPDEGEILYGYTYVGDGQTDYIPPIAKGLFTRQYTVQAAVSDAVNVTIVTPTETYVLVEDFQEIIDGINQDIEGLSIEINNINGEINTITGDINDITAGIEDINGDISTTNGNLTSHINAVAAHGVTGTVVGTTDVQTLTNKTLTRPRIANGGSIDDGNGNEVLKFTQTANAVNEINFKNNSAGNAPEIQATGNDTNIDINLVPKGTGGIKRNGNKIWDEGNDGAGSGLDADLLGGIASDEYNRKPASATAGHIALFDGNRNVYDGGNIWEKIYEITIASGGGSPTITLPSEYKYYRLLVNGRFSGQDVNIQLNGNGEDHDWAAQRLSYATPPIQVLSGHIDDAPQLGLIYTVNQDFSIEMIIVRADANSGARFHGIVIGRESSIYFSGRYYGGVISSIHLFTDDDPEFNSGTNFQLWGCK
ncbi:hypothetical protein OXPF_39230 [Oxobacter pfennigii]|uniref:Uncharacterized protein n=1 Tax=Oxobacter pfennigii TaxID=36849 RepID=A0A0N8NSI7_9CLOT|nr:hypothetical protein [Oxobacter pfennigii]KPU42144.1 hypothetical protein OXPF_39230 [Oxobacter pfennigii]